MMSKPNGSRIQRQRRVAQMRRTTVESIVHGRKKAVDALVVHARERALRFNMPAVHTVRGMRDRARTWLINRAADVVAWKIDRDTYRRQFDALEAMKMGVDRWLSTMKGISVQ